MKYNFNKHLTKFKFYYTANENQATLHLRDYYILKHLSINIDKLSSSYIKTVKIFNKLRFYERLNFHE